jgi:hypothetical protein
MRVPTPLTLIVEALRSAGPTEEIIAAAVKAGGDPPPRPNGRPRKHADRAAKDRAYRERKRARDETRGETSPRVETRVETPASRNEIRNEIPRHVRKFVTKFRRSREGPAPPALTAAAMISSVAPALLSASTIAGSGGGPSSAVPTCPQGGLLEGPDSSGSCHRAKAAAQRSRRVCRQERTRPSTD